MRPANFVLDYSHPLARGLSFASLGNAAGSSSLYDSSPYKNHRAGVDASAWINQIELQFDGSNYVHLGEIDNMPTTSVNCTFMCRFKADANLEYQLWQTWRLMAATVQLGLSFYVICEDDVFKLGYALNYMGVYPGAISLDTWYHFAITYDNVYFYTYINGVKAAGGTWYNPNQTLASIDYYLGSNYTGSANYFEGIISDVMIWGTRALTEREVSEIADPTNVMLSGMIQPIGSIGHYGDIYNLEGVR